jgi:hypothetical protein
MDGFPGMSDGRILPTKCLSLAYAVIQLFMALSFSIISLNSDGAETLSQCSPHPSAIGLVSAPFTCDSYAFLLFYLPFTNQHHIISIPC